MEINSEIKALMQLIDDPDENIYEAVSNRIVSLGKEIIPNLEHLWEVTGSEFTQERIELLIHRVHMRDLESEFREWANSNGSLLDGALLVARYQYPDLDPTFTLKEINQLSKNIWLELHQYLTPIEKVNVFNGIFYHYYKMSGTEIKYDEPNAFLINKALEAKRGNAFSNGILYLILCNQLDLPVYAIHIPRQFLLGWLQHTGKSTPVFDQKSYQVSFFINPPNGELFSMNDIENYLSKLELPIENDVMKPLNNKAVIKYLLEEFSKCFEDDKNFYKKEELLRFASMLDY